MPGQAGKPSANQTQMRGALEQGLDYLDQDSEYSLQAYIQVVLPLDGFVFWQPVSIKTKVGGSLHYGLETIQEADELAGDGPVIFTAKKQVMTFGQTKAPMLYVITIGENDANNPLENPVRFAFSQQGNFYAQADLWHYTGRRVMPAMATQLLDLGVVIDPDRAVVSNSLPLWLAMNSYEQSYPGQPMGPGIVLYPSYMVPENIAPPYAVVDIREDATTAIGSAPLLGGQFGAHTQLVKDVVDITFYGLQNNEALSFQDFVNQYSLDTDRFGIMNMPVVRDAKRTQTELKTIAMKKTMRYEVSYYQSISTTVARQLITAASATVVTNPVPIS